MLQQAHGTANPVDGMVVYDRLTTSTLVPGRAARLIAWLRQCSLDRELIAGADPASSPPLAARTAILASTRKRTHLAEGVDRLLRVAQGPQRRWWAVSRHGPVLANAAELRDLARVLRSDTPLYAQGIAIVHDLLTDGTGPAFCGSAECLSRRLSDARTAMCG
jgi:hypothetical protein